MATQDRTLELGFDRYSSVELKGLHSLLVNKDSTGSFEDLKGILLDREWYGRKKNAYIVIRDYAHLVEKSFDFTTMRKYIKHDPVVLFDLGDIIIHLFEIPLKEIPLYLNSEAEEVVLIAKWRLEKGC